MPRPGPRPYECVRRAWHSDRHQPIRGSLIQEIFRVANEVHGSATKKNKEWQEKLPFVVLKAEEIMYSKANSEAEYMDLKTLWSRVNDAIDTIIRRDESTETGNLLQPCIEAALHLGCTPRRTSRSQRNVNPRCYLSPATQELNSTSCAMENPHLGYNSSNIQQISGCPNMLKTTMADAQNGCCGPSKLSLPSTSKNNMCLAYPTPKECSTFPLYYASNCPSLNPNVEPTVASSAGQLSLHNVANVNATNLLDLNKTQAEDCDLSLRLGPSRISYSGFEINGMHISRDFASEEAKFSDFREQGNKFSVYPWGSR